MDTPADGIFSGPVTSTVSAMSLVENPFSAKKTSGVGVAGWEWGWGICGGGGGGSVSKAFKFPNFIDCFQVTSWQ